MKHPKNGKQDDRRMVALAQREYELPHAVDQRTKANKQLVTAKEYRVEVKTDSGKTKKIKDKKLIALAKGAVASANARHDRITMEIKVLKSRLGARASGGVA